MEIQIPAAIRKKAEGLFASGLYCAESVVVALAKAQGIESELLPRAATAFCSGMARTCGTCGALTGAIMGLSLGLGRTGPEESVNDTYAATQRLVREFESEFGSRDCHTLLGCDLGSQEGRAVFQENGLRQRCVGFTGRAAEIAASILCERLDGVSD
jgi:C_GCAxxG_C_C family probable redox protein